MDYRRLNDVTVKNKFPLPIVDELVDKLAGQKKFSNLVLQAGYHQIRMKGTDEEKTAFNTHSWHFKFHVMPFGLTNVPATFQCLMNIIFAPQFTTVLSFSLMAYWYTVALASRVRAEDGIERRARSKVQGVVSSGSTSGRRPGGQVVTSSGAGMTAAGC